MRCIVLRTVKYGDSSLIVDTLSRDYGRVSVVWRVQSGRQSKRGAGSGKVSRNVFQPLTICDITTERSATNRLPLVKDAHIAMPYVSLNIDPVKVSVAFFIAEFLVQVSRSEQRDAEFYDFVESSLHWYDLADAATANFHLMFLVRAARFLGFYPNMDSYRRGCVFDLRAAEFAAAVPLHRDWLATEDADRIGLIMRMTPANMHLFRFSRTERNRIIEIILRFYALHVADFREMKSWPVLKEIFS